VLAKACCVEAHWQDVIKIRGCSLNWRRYHGIPLNTWSKPRNVSFTIASNLSQIRTYYRQNTKPRFHRFNNVIRPSTSATQPYASNGRAPVWFGRTDERRIGNQIPAMRIWKIKGQLCLKLLRWERKAIPPDLVTSFSRTSIPIFPRRPAKWRGRCYNSDYVYNLNELLICDSEYTRISIFHLLQMRSIVGKTSGIKIQAAYIQIIVSCICYLQFSDH